MMKDFPMLQEASFTNCGSIAKIFLEGINMYIPDKGVLENSVMEFLMPSEFAENTLLYVREAGHFYCTSQYAFSRSYLDTYLIIYVAAGKMRAVIEGQSMNVPAGSAVLIDSHRPHGYACITDSEFYWTHFNGKMSANYCNYLFRQKGNVFDGDYQFRKNTLEDFQDILQNVQRPIVNEHLNSYRLHHLLSQFAAPARSTEIDRVLQPAIRAFSKNIAENFTLPQLADLCGVSVSTFLRTFRKNFNCTPHEYMVKRRISEAQRLLSNTTMTVGDIAIDCGFNSATHFCRAFRANIGMSPKEFRVLWAENK
jgi:AraC family transcriptional regulator